MTITAKGSFFSTTSVEQEGRTWIVLLDQHKLRSPSRAVIRLPTRALAELIANEWMAQENAIDPANMPLSRMVNVACDHMGSAKSMTAGELVRYAAGDLLCYRVEEPLALQELQAMKWDVWLQWAEKEFGAKFDTTTGLTGLNQPIAVLENIRNRALEMEPFLLTGLAHVTALLGSAVLGFALAQGELTAEEAHLLSRVEETFQMERWGKDEEAEERSAYLLASLQSSASYLKSLQT